MYFVLEKLLVLILLCHMTPLDNNRYLTTTNCVARKEQLTAMLDGRPISYSRHTLFTYRRVPGRLKFTFIDRLAECGLLHYRGSRGGQVARTRRLKSKQPEKNNNVEIPGLISVNIGNGFIPTIIGNRPDHTRSRRDTSYHGRRQATLIDIRTKPHWPFPNLLNANVRSVED